MLDIAVHYNLLKTLEETPEVSQRELAQQLGVSLGRVNYCLKALVEKGNLKINNFRNSNNKLAYRYLLTSSGMEQKARMTVEFLQIKIAEYERLEVEILGLKREVERQSLTAYVVSEAV